MNIKIKDIPLKERPRERLIQYGASSLSSEELLAILLKTGTKKESAKVLASYILSQLKEITNLGEVNYNQLVAIKGIGEAKACNILAAVELGKRLQHEVSSLHRQKLNSAYLIYQYYRDLLKGIHQEYFYCIYLNSQKEMICDKLLFQGTLNYSLVHPREIFKEAYLNSAASIICVHNHPTGNVIPSKEDCRLTEQLVSVGKLLGLPVIDHIIVGREEYYSFYENNLIS